MHAEELLLPHIVEPHFKGIVHEPDPNYTGLVTGRDEHGVPLEEGQILQLLEKCPSVELVTDVRRALFAAALAVDMKRAGLSALPELYSPEGCPHRVGSHMYRGGQMFAHMWSGDLLPSDVRGALELSPLAMIDVYSDCTSREVRRTLARLLPDGRLDVVTDAYQAPRSDAYIERMKAPGQAHAVHTPESLLPILSKSKHLPEAFRRFLGGVYSAVAVRFIRDGVEQREAKDEGKYRVLNVAARVSSFLHLPNPEEWLAAKLRSDRKLIPMLFPDRPPLPPQRGRFLEREVD